MNDRSGQVWPGLARSGQAGTGPDMSGQVWPGADKLMDRSFFGSLFVGKLHAWVPDRSIWQNGERGNSASFDPDMYKSRARQIHKHMFL